ncbi:hypothetical protein AMS68_006988 [Peltaster fructicola]|uniref:Rad4 beta-hairpin domain-containing protein n=1 Tax=Peltaster fructicola TaxID=286661 RepID=A0A6H0Y3I0_9PEZI|nr:hypothetical protein AMS68_006988 [Peltaster fructicola]
MPPRKALSVVTKAPKRQARATASSAKQEPAGIYDDLIAEATSETDFHSHDERPLKRRRPTPRAKPVIQSADAPPVKGKEREVAQSRSQVGTVPGLDDYLSGSEVAQNNAGLQSRRHEDAITDLDDNLSDSDLAFEDIDLENSSIIDIDSDEELEDVNISLGRAVQDGTGSSSRRRQVPRYEKELRFLGHKAHFVAMLGHCMVVNSRCNDRRVHRVLKPLLASTTRAYLRPNKEHTQFQQDRTFTMGLERACDTFREAFHVNAPGLTRAYWQGEKEFGDHAVLDRAEFREAAVKLAGSQDIGNQLFCALLRACGVHARLVCSLQVLPLANTIAASQTPTKPHKPRVFAIAPDTPIGKQDSSNLSIRERAVASARSRIGQPAFKATVVTSPAPRKSKPYHKLSYPVFWVEVLNAAYQKWAPVDPIVTQTFKKASKLEPPLSYPLNQLVYAIAFSKNGSAKDVTRRYAKAYNAKTRRMRLETTSEANRLWHRKVMGMFTKQSLSDADMVEETELTQRLAREGLPGNIQDFKGHPIYALERHLKRHEVIQPRREAGKVNAGTAAHPKMEPIYRREDVHVCRSADQWYRHGRVVKAGEQALKHVPARSRPKDSEDEIEQGDTALYTLQQTELYIPKAVVRGKIPRNAFGNLDVYVPSMVPNGAAHIRHPLAKSAAEILQIDAVDAVTGFKFARRKGTAVIEGAIVPEQYLDATHTVIEGLLWQEVDERSKARSALAMRMWKRLLQGLKIAERVASYATEPMQEVDSTLDMSNSTAWYADDDVPLHTAGRYTLDEIVDMAKAAKKTSKAKKRRQADSELDETDGEAMDDIEDIPDDRLHSRGRADVNELGGGFLPESPNAEEPAYIIETGGGFTMDDTDGVDSGGGFIVDDADTAQADGVQDNQIRHPLDTEVTSVHDQRSGSLRKPSTHGGRSARANAEQAVDVEDDDQDSLLSHDPEDDDVEPDWMESE